MTFVTMREWIADQTILDGHEWMCAVRADGQVFTHPDGHDMAMDAAYEALGDVDISPEDHGYVILAGEKP